MHPLCGCNGARPDAQPGDPHRRPPGGGTILRDTWQLGARWSHLTPGTSAPPAILAGLAGDPGSGHLVLFGGVSGSAGQTSKQTWVWGPFTVTPRSLPVGRSAVRYSQALQATGGKGSLACSISLAFLPPGISLSRQGCYRGPRRRRQRLASPPP
jgi:hypothetical protein